MPFERTKLTISFLSPNIRTLFFHSNRVTTIFSDVYLRISKNFANFANLYFTNCYTIIYMKVQTFICNMLHENCYVVFDEQSREAAVIDPGFYWNDEKQLFADFVEENQLQIKYMLCTHLHFDHIFGTSFIAEKYGVELSANLADASWIDNFVASVSRFGIRPNGTPCPIGHKLHDGDLLPLGADSLQCIATPGHSAGGFCFYSQESGMLFSGDTLFQSSIGRTDFEDGSYAQLIRSIQERLLTLPANTIVYPGHGDATSIGDEMQYNPYI